MPHHGWIVAKIKPQIMKKTQLFTQWILLLVFIFSVQKTTAIPLYFDLDVGEKVKPAGFPEIELLQTKINLYDSTIGRIGASSILLTVDGKEVEVPVGYAHAGIVFDNYKIGAELIRDYVAAVERHNRRFKLFKDARIWIARADEPLLPSENYSYPLFSPWKSGMREQGWLTVAYNIEHIEGSEPWSPGRYHDGWDFGVWENQLVRSFSAGKVVSPDDYPSLIENGLLYNKNNALVGPNPFLVKDPDLPILYYYTHLSGLARNYQVGDEVKAGEIIAYASNRGSSGGWYHLHFSMIHLENGYHINPFPFLKETYGKDMTHFHDFLGEFQVYRPASGINPYDFERSVLHDEVEANHTYQNALPGIVQMRDAVALSPLSGFNHALFDQLAVLKTNFETDESMPGEVWLGHNGDFRVYLNGNLIYAGKNADEYDAGKKPFQWDQFTIPAEFEAGDNEIVIFTRQNNPFWSFSIRVRDRLGRPLKNLEE